MTKATNSIIAPIGTDTDTDKPFEAPEWIHLIPAGTFIGADGRGPYVVTSPESVVSASIQRGQKLPIDINHAIDFRSATGDMTPAQGWIVALEARDDGIWGKVEWTPMGRWAVHAKEYGFISPVFAHSKDAPHQVIKLMRAAITNNPNLTLTSLHQREDKAMLEQLRKALGLPETADEAAVMAAVTAAHSANQAHVALMARITTTAGLADNADGEAIVTALQAAIAKPAATGDAAEIVNLKGQVAALHNQLSSYVKLTSEDKAKDVIEHAIVAGKIVPALRDHYVARHVKDAAEVEKEIALLPSLHAGGLGGRLPPKTADGAQLSAEEANVMAMMGVEEAAFMETHKSLHGKAV